MDEKKSQETKNKLIDEILSLTKAKLEELADPKCRVCNGRGHVGQYTGTLMYKPCPRCVVSRKKVSRLLEVAAKETVESKEK